MLTGLHPITHRVIKNGLSLGLAYDTLPELMRDRGYRTGAIVSAFVLDRRFGLAQGFDHYDDEIPQRETTWQVEDFHGHRVPGGFDRRADFTTARAIGWLRAENARRPFFLFVHYFAPHAPYAPPPEYARRFAPTGVPPENDAHQVGLYDAEIAFTDHEVGRLLSELHRLALAKDTLVIVTADHGEGLRQHQVMYHGQHIYEEAVRVPLVMRLPGVIPAGVRIGQPVEHVDLARTILDFIGAGLPSGFPGRSLAPALLNRQRLPADHPVFLHRRHFEGGDAEGFWAKGELFGIRRDSWKYIEGEDEQRRELYHLSSDPTERVNLVSERADETARLARELAAWRARSSGHRPVIDRMTPEDEERLKALGYVR
jgi:arylsulfatase A-like enzyme